MTGRSQPSEPHEEGRLWEAFAHSVRANVLAEACAQTIRVGGFIFLARWLAPADLGMLRILIAVTIFAGITNSTGIADALVQREQLNADHEAAGWWMNLGIAALNALVLYAAAPLLERLLAMAGLAGLLRLLCIPLFIDGTAYISTARLRRRLEFSVLAKADVVAEATFLLTALILLFSGLPRWSLPAGLGARITTRALFVWLSEKYIPRSLPRLAPARDLVRFSTSVWGGRMLVAVSSNFDYLLVGRLLGGTVLGYYGMAWDLLRFIPDRLYNVAGRVTLPAFARLQNDDDALRRAYCHFSGYMARVVLPITAFAAVAAPQLVVGIYGTHWRSTATPLRILSLGLALCGMRLAIGSVYYTKNRPSLDIWLHGLRLALITVAIYATAPFGLIGVSAAMSVVESAISIIGQLLACRLIQLRGASLVRAWWPGAITGGACAFGAFVGVKLAAACGLQGAPALAVVAMPAAAIFLWLQLDTVRAMLGSLVSRQGAGVVVERAGQPGLLARGGEVA